MDISKELVRYRQEAGLSQRALATRSGVASSTVARIESGRLQPSTEVARQLLHELGLQLVVANTARSALAKHRRDLRHLLAGHGCHNPRIFGSVARGDDGPDSDLDILCRTDDGFSLLDLVEASEAAEALLGCRVDIIDDRGSGDVLASAQREAIPL